MMAHFGRPREKFSNGTLPKPKPYTKEMFKKQSDLYLQGYFGAEDKELYKNNLENVFKKGVEEGVVSEEEALEWIQDRKKIYSTLIEEAGKQPAEFPPAYSVEPDINKYYENQLATGGRVGLEGGSDILTVDAHGSKTGAQQIENAPKGWTSDKETFDIIAGLKIPVSKKIKLLADLQYGKYRDQIEYKDQDVHLEDPKSYRERKFGISYNEGGEGLSGHAKVNVDTGDPEAYIQFTKKFEDGGRVGFDEGTKPVLPRDKFVELRITHKNKTNTEFAELLNKDWRPSQADSFNKDSVTKRIKDAKHLFPDNFDYKGSHVERALTPEKYISVIGKKEYEKIKNNPKKLKNHYEFANLTDKQKANKVERTKKWIASLNSQEYEDKILKSARKRSQILRGDLAKFHKNTRNFKSMLWGSLVDRTYRNYSKNKTGELKIKSGGLEPPPFKLSEESLKLIKSKPELNRVDMEKITLIDENGKPFKWDTLESYVKEGNALNSKKQPMSWDDITKTYRVMEFKNKEGLTQKINKKTIPNYDPKRHIRQSGWNIAHNTSFNNAPWETHIAPARANVQEGQARKNFLKHWDSSDADFKEGKITKKERFNSRKKEMTKYKKTMELIPEIIYGLNKKQHGAATPIEKLFEKAGIKLNAGQLKKAQLFLRSALNKGQDISKFIPLPGRGAAAALDYSLFHFLFDVPSKTAALGASTWLTKSRPISDTILAQTQTMSFIDEMNQKKAEEDRIKNLEASKRLRDLQSTATDITPFKLDEKEEVVTENKPTYGFYADQIKNLKIP